MYYHRNLPHMMPPGETLFITFRLAGSLPQQVIEQLKIRFAAPAHEEEAGTSYARQRRYFGAFDALLNDAAQGPKWLWDACIAEVVVEALRYRDGHDYTLWAYCLMPNHVYLLVSVPPEATTPFYKVLQSLKARTARACNILLQQTHTPFWQAESYDHVVRDGEEMKRIISYILENPVKAGLIEDWQQWPHTYLNPAY
jgi:REP element-mobilizing transposase RayT